MKIFRDLARVRLAQATVVVARHEMSVPADALLARGRRYPLTTVGAAAGAGLIMGSLNAHPLRVPGVGALLGGGVAEAAAFGARWLTELGLGGFAARRHAHAPAVPPARDDSEPA
jgi:hypothetical protein